jgi:drug/metabolite transporter (DMT)-like permease
MHNSSINPLVILAFAIVFIVWGSTYFFIAMAVHGFPPMLMGAVRYLAAGSIMLIFCSLKGDKLPPKKDLISSAVSGFLMLTIGTGVAIWVERTIPSAMVAIMASVAPIWFIVLDKANWRTNLRNKTTIYGLIIGFSGVVLLFGEAFLQSLSGAISRDTIVGLLLLIAGPIAWSAGSLYSKKHGGNGPARVTTAWQMIFAGLVFIPMSLLHQEFNGFRLSQVPLQSWLAIAYLVIFGSIAAFSAYIWLLQVRPAAQVSIHAYVNPVIAVLLGVCFASESISGWQLLGLFIILFSVLLVNLPRYGKMSVGVPVLNKA